MRAIDSNHLSPTSRQAPAQPTGIVEVPSLGVKADLSRMVVFTSAKNITLTPDAAAIRAFIEKPDTTSIGYGLNPPQSVFGDDRRLETVVKPATREAALQVLNRFGAQLSPPKRFALSDVGQLGEGGLLQLGRSTRQADGLPSWSWTYFDPSKLKDKDLEALVNVEVPGLELPRPSDASIERRGSWPDSPVAKYAMNPERLNRWDHAPNSNCDQVAVLTLYPQLKNWAFHEFHPLVFSDRFRGTSGDALLMPEQRSALEGMRARLPPNTKPLFTADAPLQTGSIVYLVDEGFNLGHVVTVVGVLDEPGKPRDFVVMEKPNPGLLPTTFSRLSDVVKQYPNTPKPVPTFNPTGAPLPPRGAPVIPLQPDQFEPR